MISARLCCPYQWARLDGPAARIARWSMRLLQGRNVVVVGGSRGVGRSIAEAALSERATVMAVARGEPALAQFAWETPGVKTFAVDATVESAPDEVFAALEPDALVICAGALAPSAPLYEQNWKAFSANWGDGRPDIVPVLQGRAPTSAQSGRPDHSDLQWRSLDRGPPNSGGYAGAKRMQMFLAGHSQKESDRLGLDLRFMAASRAFRPRWASGRWSSSRAC